MLRKEAKSKVILIIQKQITIKKTFINGISKVKISFINLMAGPDVFPSLRMMPVMLFLFKNKNNTAQSTTPTYP